MDNLTEKQRSFCMSKIRSNDTKVEIAFRKYIWRENLKGYRLKSNIKGKPDLYYPSAKIAIFIDGCFWHKCPKCFIKPKSKNEYWDCKISNNVKRDRQINNLLKKKGITVLRFWEHEINDNMEKCYKKLRKIYENYNQDN